MKFDIDIRHFFKSTGSKFSSRIVRPLIDPSREWVIGFFVSVVAFLVVALYLGYDFYIQMSHVEQPPVVVEDVVQYRSKDADSVLTQYQARKAQFDALRSEKKDLVVDMAPETSPSADTGSTSPETVSQDVLVLDPLADDPDGQ